MERKSLWRIVVRFPKDPRYYIYSENKAVYETADRKALRAKAEELIDSGSYELVEARNFS